MTIQENTECWQGQVTIFLGLVLNIHPPLPNGDKFTQRAAGILPAEVPSACFAIFARPVGRENLAGKGSQAQNMPFFSPKQGLQNRSQLISSALF
ncbi:MAG: hypothetical protein ABSF34_10470 [Verrucomicrobiota bacterium]|jgi:hypothetical protein